MGLQRVSHDWSDLARMYLQYMWNYQCVWTHWNSHLSVISVSGLIGIVIDSFICYHTNSMFHLMYRIFCRLSYLNISGRTSSPLLFLKIDYYLWVIFFSKLFLKITRVFVCGFLDHFNLESSDCLQNWDILSKNMWCLSLYSVHLPCWSEIS